MPAAIRRFERRDRDQLAQLINDHVAAVIPGVTLSVNTILGQLEREPREPIVDAWVQERRCLVAERDDGIAAAALLQRFRTGTDVGEDYRDTGEIRWLVCRIDAIHEGARLLEAALEQMRAWHLRSVGADCTLPALACFGIPDTLPHLRGLLSDAGFGEPARTELVLVARCEALIGPSLPGTDLTRSLGALGARLTVSRDAAELGFIEVCDQPAEMARSSTAARWADIGNLAIRDTADPATTLPALLSAAAQWLTLGGVTRLIAYWADDVDSPQRLAGLQRAGFALLVRNERGFTRSLP